ncbi:MAG: DUF4469 domain-containing protein [Dysgonamonadaceae bacterium]|jgi:hypothetical protein|nr:DUF4469 domain-containing protein [Dysgonamonadaceae bacterium]
MNTIKQLKDVIHRVAVWFVANTLPEAKKKYVARPETLPYLGISEVAAKAEIYGESVDPDEMIRYVERYFNICAYLVADGYGIENQLFRTRIRIPGEYDGYETSLQPGLHPEVRINVSLGFRAYIREHVNLEFKGIDETQGHMFTFLDEATNLYDQITPGGLLRITGTGIKIADDGQPEHQAVVGLWLVDAASDARTRVSSVAVNEPRTIVALIPQDAHSASGFYLEVVTQTSAKNSGQLLKNPRTIRSEHALPLV